MGIREYINQFVIQKKKAVALIIEQRKEKTERERLKRICETAMEKKEFQRHYMYKNNTYCNQGSEWILRQMGYRTDYFYSYWKERNIDIVTTANQIYDKCVKACKDGILKKIDRETAQELSWKGIPCLLIAKSKDPKRWGHVSVTYPSPMEEDFLICNIGWDNLVCSPDDPKSFAGGKSYLTDYDIYQVPKIA